MSRYLPPVTSIEISWNLSRNAFGKRTTAEGIRKMEGVILAISASQFAAVDAILPPNVMIQVTYNEGGHALNGRGLVEAAKVHSDATPNPFPLLCYPTKQPCLLRLLKD